jgi:DNA uptake protein ComE-like DNA-binding protein
MEHRVRSRPSGRLGAVGERVVEGIVGTPSPAARDMSMDINTAPVLRLKSLSGIGEHYAKKIVEGRPYRNSEELLTRHILPEYIYGRIVDRLVVGQP